MGVLTIRSIHVRRGAVDVELYAPPETEHTARCPDFASRLLALLPELDVQTCGSGDQPAQLADTRTAHAFEHVVLGLSERISGRTVLWGGTSWDSAAWGRGAYRVTFTTPDDFSGVAAVNLALRVVDACWTGEPLSFELEEACRHLAHRRRLLVEGSPAAKCDTPA